MCNVHAKNVFLATWIDKQLTHIAIIQRFKYEFMPCISFNYFKSAQIKWRSWAEEHNQTDTVTS